MIKQDRKLWTSFATLISLWGIIFYQALLGMESIWRRSDTFAHGYFIVPIVLWLLWRDKAYFLNSNTQTSWWALPFVFGGLISYLFAYAADINVLGQLAAVITLIALIWLLIGNHLAWHYKFPLAYLLFLVPMGENLIPQLQDVTAWFTVAFLKIHGIPVFRDGLYIQVPSGLFEVAVACSGIRYLIASVAVGTLFAYLSYRSVKKQFIFIVFAFVLPILANGIRAYLIVIIAHYSDMKYATGADHLVYGWIFFGLVIMLMFWVGGIFTDPEISEAESKRRALHTIGDKKNSIPLLSIVVMFLILTLGIRSNIPEVTPPADVVNAIDDITQQHFMLQELSTKSHWGITFKHSLKQSHLINENHVEIFRAEYANKQSLGEMINYNNYLFDPKYWTVIEQKEIVLDQHPAMYLLLHNIAGVNRVVIYWYQVGDEIVLNKNIAKLKQVVHLFISPNIVSSINAYSASDGNPEQLKIAIESNVLTLPTNAVNEQNQYDE